VESEYPKISIVTPSFNSVETIEQTILSVLGQGYNNIEYLVIDGDSNDGTIELLKKYKNDIDYCVSEKDNGIYHAMNKGIAAASGDFIGIINADDCYEEGAIFKVANLIKSSSSIEAVYANSKYLIPNRPPIIIQGRNPLKRDDFFNMPMAHTTVFIKKKCFDLYGGFDESFKASGDFDLLFRFFDSGVQFTYLDTVLTEIKFGGLTSTSFISNQENKLVIKKRGASLNMRLKSNLFAIKRYLAVQSQHNLFLKPFFKIYHFFKDSMASA